MGVGLLTSLPCTRFWEMEMGKEGELLCCGVCEVERRRAKLHSRATFDEPLLLLHKTRSHACMHRRAIYFGKANEFKSLRYTFKMNGSYD